VPGTLVVDAATGQQRGSLVAGLGAGAVRVRAENVACVQVRLARWSNARFWAPPRPTWRAPWWPSMACGAGVQLSVMGLDVKAHIHPEVSIEVDDVDAVYQRAVKAGSEIVYPVTSEDRDCGGSLPGTQTAPSST
jgi:hypothetical protein